MGQEKQDRRVSRTRARLRQSLIELLQEKDIRKISVTELAERADVNRGTFYSHYQDLYDMVLQLQEELLQEFDGVLRAYPAQVLEAGLYPILRDVFGFIRRNAELCMIFLSRGEESRFLKRLKDMVYERVVREWGELYPFPTQALRSYVLSFFVGGAVGLIQKWAEGGWKETPEELATLGQQMIEGGISALGL